MREMEIAMAIICQADKYHLQLRDGAEKIGAAGKVGCFGGKVEIGEKPRDTVSRELAEETNLVFAPDSFTFLDSVFVESDYERRPIDVTAKVFEVLLPLGLVVEAKEGQLVTWTRGEILEHQSQLTPATKEFFRGYFK